MSQRNKDILITSGFPRSGNTFLNFTLQSLYYEGEPNVNFHTVKSIQSKEKFITPIRNPIDCIASWNLYPSRESLDMDIKYYIRFHNTILENIDKVVFFDFDRFTNDIEYVKNKVKDSFNINSIFDSDIVSIKQNMLKYNKEINLPRNNTEDLKKIKDILIYNKLFQECFNIYNTIKIEICKDHNLSV